MIEKVKYEVENAGLGEEAIYILVDGEPKKVDVPDDCDTEVEK